MSRFIEPAFFGPGDVDREIQRLSQRFDAGPRTLQPPRWWKGSQSIIAYWGDVTLEPLDAEGRARIAAGQSAQSGILFDFLGDFGRSEKENLPIFQLGGGEGYVWGARIDENGKGALRMTAIDATQFVPPTAVARLETGRSVGKDSPETAVPAPKPKILLSSGSGFFVSNDGHVLTNNHVIEDCNSIRVFMDTAAPVEARAIARDSSNDLALLATSLKPPAVAAPRSVLRLGEAVAAFGYPHADILATSGNFTQGSVTALVGLGDDSRYLQMSVPVQAGNSGGPLLDQNGNLVGIVASKLNAIKVLIDSGDLPQNVNFALKASVVENFLDSNRIKYVMGSATSALKSEDLADQARSMSVFILCK
ncbi:MAG: serine protease [Methylocella sp.]